MEFKEVEPKGTGIRDLAEAVVERLGLGGGKANHPELLIALLKFKKNEYPLDMEEIARILGVSVPQAYREIRKWKELGLVEVVKTRVGEAYARGYVLTAPTANRLIDKAESAVRSFLRRTKRIAKELDDKLATENLSRKG